MRENFDQSFHLEVEIPKLSCAMKSCRFVQICFLDSSPHVIIPFVFVLLEINYFRKKYPLSRFIL